MLGCFRPLHNCIDNVIHSAAGVQVRCDCNDIMRGKEAAAKVAVETVREYKAKTNSSPKVIFNVFTEKDYAIYKRLLGKNRQA